jgi:hypothetical protein
MMAKVKPVRNLAMLKFSGYDGRMKIETFEYLTINCLS